MEKRVIIAFVLSFVVLYGFQRFLSPPKTGEKQEQQSAQTQPVAPPSTPTPLENHAVEKKEVAPPPPQDLQAQKAEDFTIETPLYTATLSNVGGVLKSYKLKTFSDGAGHPLELINQTVGNRVGWPLAVTTGDKAIDDELAKATYVGQRDSNSLKLEFSANGLYARRDLVFDADKYMFSVQTVVTKDGKDLPYSVVWHDMFGDQSIVPQDPRRQNALYQTDTGGYSRISLGTLKYPPEPTFRCGFLGFSTCSTSMAASRVGVEDQYFAAILESVQSPGQVNVQKQQYTGNDGKPAESLVVSMRMPDRGQLRVYAGPKQEAALTQADPQLAGVLDYGTWSFIAKPLLAILLSIHKYVGNFGWAIILLTIALNLVLFPLRLKQQVSMLKMQKIQPQMRRLQDQYKKLKAGDPRREEVQKDMMRLYSEHGVNPVGGCLPLILQMPLLFAFYSALSYSIELRRAPWIFWIKDLSQPDPYYIIPIAMAVAMFLQQKMTPTATVDPAQAKMMMVMPLVFTFMFLSYGSGLALYWLTGSIIGVGQQVFINKYWSPQAEAKLRAKSPPEEKRGT